MKIVFYLAREIIGGYTNFQFDIVPTCFVSENFYRVENEESGRLMKTTSPKPLIIDLPQQIKDQPPIYFYLNHLLHTYGINNDNISPKNRVY